MVIGKDVVNRENVVHRQTEATAAAPLRILHVLPDLDRGGGQQVLRRMIQGTTAGRFVHHVCYFLPSHELRPGFEDAGAIVHYLPRESAWSFVRLLPALIRLVREEAIDIVHINGTPVDKVYGQLTALLCRRPLVSTLHGPRWRPGFAWRPGPLWKLAKHRLRETAELLLDPVTTRRVVAVSESVLDSWRPYLESRHVPRERMLVNRNGVPTADFDRDAHREAIARVRAELGAQGADPILVTVGRLDVNKGHRFLLPVMERVRERLPEALLFVIGEGPEEGALRAAIAERDLGDHVVLLGAREDVPALLGMSDVFVFSSLGEGMPLAVLEAMAASLPVVAFHLPGLDGLIEDGIHGFQVAPEDTGALGDRVLELLGDRAACREMGNRGRLGVVARYDVERSTRGFEEIYAEVARR